MKILLVNVGNTCTTIACAGSADAVKVLGRMIRGFPSSSSRALAMVSACVSRYRISDAVLCCVVPTQALFWRTILAEKIGRPPMVIGPDLELGVTLDYPKPKTIGSDRLADVCGATKIYGAPVLVVDIGTAATFNMVRAGGRFVGGAIAPGPAMFTQYLSDRTAQLPLVDLPSERVPRVGRNTKDAIRLAVGVGYPGMVAAIVRHILGSSQGRVPVVVTGGYAQRVLGRERGRYVVDPLLTLRGMACAHALDQERARS